MGWRKMLGGFENKNLTAIGAKGAEAVEKPPFAYIAPIADKSLKSTSGHYSTISHNKHKRNPPPVEVYPDCRGWKIADLNAWKRCLECEWAWVERGAHVCLDQGDKRVDYAMKECHR